VAALVGDGLGRWLLSMNKNVGDLIAFGVGTWYKPAINHLKIVFCPKLFVGGKI
jgi:hypothetical protein